MLQNQRYHKILEELKLKKAVKVTALAKELGISESTIRRDINELDKQQKLRKVFGGAVLTEGDVSGQEFDVIIKSEINVAEKDLIARYAATMINDNDFIFIDAGTTTEKMIDYIENRRATYVTSGIVHAKKLMQRGCKTYLIGGLLKFATEAITGTEAIESLRKYNFSKCFMGTNGVNIHKGFTTPDIEEAAVKAEAMKNAYVSFVLADHSKFGMVSSVTFAELANACIITDKLEDDTYKKYTVIEEA